MNPKAYAFIGLGFELVVLVLAMLWIGGKIDQAYGWNGLAAAFGMIIALISWITHLLIVVRSLAKDPKAGDSDRP